MVIRWLPIVSYIYLIGGTIYGSEGYAHSIVGRIAVNMILCCASGGTLAVIIACWAQVTTLTFMLHLYICLLTCLCVYFLVCVCTSLSVCILPVCVCTSLSVCVLPCLCVYFPVCVCTSCLCVYFLSVCVLPFLCVYLPVCVCTLLSVCVYFPVCVCVLPCL